MALLISFEETIFCVLERIMRAVKDQDVTGLKYQFRAGCFPTRPITAQRRDGTRREALC